MPEEKAYIKSVLFNISGTFAYFFSQWLITIIIVQMSGYESAGIFSLVVSFSNIFMFLSQYGIRNFQISDIKENYSVGQYFGARIIAILIALAGFFICIPLSQFDRYTTICCMVYMTYKILETITDFVFAVFQKHDNYRAIAFSYYLKSLAPFLGFVAVLAIAKDLMLAIIAMSASYLLILAIYDFSIFKKRETISVSFSNNTSILKSCTSLMVATLITPYMTFVIRFFIDRLYGKEILGYFSSVSMVVVILTTLASAVWFVIVPVISTEFLDGNYARIKKQILLVCGGILLIGLLAIVFGKLLGNFLFALLFGNEILDYMYLLTPVLLSSILLTAVAFFATILIPMQKRIEMLICCAVGAVVCSIVVYPLTKNDGMIGANNSLILGLAVQLTLLVVLTVRTLKLARVPGGDKDGVC